MREMWNRKYSTEPYTYEPNRRLTALAHLLPGPGRALDLACGGGRNTLWLAERGWAVDAWDLSDVGLELLRVALAGRPELAARVQIRQVDIEAPGFTLPPAQWDLIVVSLFLHRPLFPHLAAAVKPGGYLFHSIYLDAGPGARHRPEHKLQPGELAAAFAPPAWIRSFYAEDPAAGNVTMLARKAPLPPLPPAPAVC